MKKNKILSLFLALMMICAVLPGCGDGSGSGTEGSNGLQAERKANNEIVAAIAEDLKSLDPHSSTTAGTREVLFNIYEGLFKTGPDGELIPAVAEKYTTSADGLTYTFTLRDGVRFHNGNAVTAEDVIYSIKRCADNEGSAIDSSLVSAFSVISDVQATDDKTVVLTLKQPDLELLNFLTAAIVPANYDKLDTEPCGTGPFKFSSRSVKENFVIEKFDEYWGTPASLSKVTFQVYDDSTALVNALQSGAVDLCSKLTSAQTAQLSDSYTILEGTMNLVQAVYLNNNAAPFDNEKVHQAISYAINRQQILDMVADGHGAAVGSSIYPKLAKYFLPELVNYYEYNPEKAKQLLAEAGYPNGFDMSIAVISSYQPHMDTAEVVVEQLRAIGVNAEVVPMDEATWADQVYKNRQFQATINGLAAKNTTASDMLARFVSTNGKNFVNYNNSEYDALYAQAQACTDDAQQTAIYKQLETMLTETAANLYLQDLANLVAIRSDLTGYQFYPIYAMDFSTVAYSK